MIAVHLTHIQFFRDFNNPNPEGMKRLLNQSANATEPRRGEMIAVLSSHSTIFTPSGWFAFDG
jgi:hypothetical protein